ncbi:MAG: hypothetical protein FWG98_01670 [Candidatus Cloacimonetes bacterium]|nr:hypothetical protein [Candidatus Cloacimonadota bacterium]
MSWFLCIISQKPFLEWEIEKFLQVHPQTTNTIIKPAFYFSYSCRDELLFISKATEDDPTIKLVIGKGYILKGTGYSQADASDWNRLLNFEYLPSDIDGHYLALKIRENFLQITCDKFGHYPVYYINTEDYVMISNKQHYISQLMGQKQWDYAALSALALLPLRLEKRPFLRHLSMLKEGSTLTVDNNTIEVVNRELKFISSNDSDTQKYLFSLKKSFELQLKEKDFILIPFEADYSARFAFSIWCKKEKSKWGLYHFKPQNAKEWGIKDEITDPVEYIEDYVLSKLRIQNIPDNQDSNNLFSLYKDYVLHTGLADIPEYFYLAGSYDSETKSLQNDIYFLSHPTEWLFEKEPIKRLEKYFKILKSRSFTDFKKNYISKNHFFRKEFYPFLVKGLKQNFEDFTRKMYISETIYDKYHFLLTNHHINNRAVGLGWLNKYRNFFSPGMLYSLSCSHLQERFANNKIIETSLTLHSSFSEDSNDFPIPKEVKYTYPNYPNLNFQYFSLISNEIGLMIEKAEKIPYYHFSNLLKIFKKAKKGNDKSIEIIMKWVAFEIWREFIE